LLVIVAKMGTRKVELGPVGHAVKAHIRRIRDRNGMTLREVSDRLARYGRPILPSGLAKIEKGDRRVDVDDLVAIARALGVNPERLLQVPFDSPTEDDDKDLMEIAQKVLVRQALRQMSEADRDEFWTLKRNAIDEDEDTDG
jgi:transcriptional regulator with XRE-family HTH domain